MGPDYFENLDAHDSAIVTAAAVQLRTMLYQSGVTTAAGESYSDLRNAIAKYVTESKAKTE